MTDLLSLPEGARSARVRRVLSALFLLSALMLCAGSASAAGRKYAVSVGINAYPDPIPQLAGCVNDAKNLQAALMEKFGFTSANTTLLTDEEATRQNIINAISSYQQRATAGDLFVFTYSGHGTLFPDNHSEELDETRQIYMEMEGEVIYPRGTYDSAICPIDSDDTTSGKPWGNLILDDELYALFKGFTDKGANVVFLSDSCHSGSIARAVVKKGRPREVSLVTIRGKKNFSELKLARPKKQRRQTGSPNLGGHYIVMTGSDDNEFSLDWETNEGNPTGLFTLVLLDTINRRGTNIGYKDLMSAVTRNVAALSLQAENNQHPQLDLRFFSGDANTKIFSVPEVRGRGRRSRRRG